MKNIFLSALLLCGLSLSARAEDMKNHPCHKIKEACEAQGFIKGHHKEGKGLWKDCIGKIKVGEPVAGVTVSADDVAACKAKMEARKAKKKG
jgi:hypothetical protein